MDEEADEYDKGRKDMEGWIAGEKEKVWLHSSPLILEQRVCVI